MFKVIEQNERTPLHFAASNSHLEGIAVLTSHPNIDINAKSLVRVNKLKFSFREETHHCIELYFGDNKML